VTFHDFHLKDQTRLFKMFVNSGRFVKLLTDTTLTVPTGRLFHTDEHLMQTLFVENDSKFSLNLFCTLKNFKGVEFIIIDCRFYSFL